MKRSSVNSSLYFMIAVISMSIYAYMNIYVRNECITYNEELARLYYQSEQLNNQVKVLNQRLNKLSSRARIEKIALNKFNMTLSPPVNFIVKYREN